MVMLEVSLKPLFPWSPSSFLRMLTESPCRHLLKRHLCVSRLLPASCLTVLSDVQIWLPQEQEYFLLFCIYLAHILVLLPWRLLDPWSTKPYQSHKYWTNWLWNAFLKSRKTFTMVLAWLLILFYCLIITWKLILNAWCTTFVQVS